MIEGLQVVSGEGQCAVGVVDSGPARAYIGLPLTQKHAVLYEARSTGALGNPQNRGSSVGRPPAILWPLHEQLLSPSPAVSDLVSALCSAVYPSSRMAAHHNGARQLWHLRPGKSTEMSSSVRFFRISQTPAPRRVRLTRSSGRCARCRDMKVRCSGTTPCARCQKKGHECYFRPEDTRATVPLRDVPPFIYNHAEH